MKGDPDAAIADYDQAIALNPQVAMAYTVRVTLPMDLVAAVVSAAVSSWSLVTALSAPVPAACMARVNLAAKALVAASELAEVPAWAIRA